MDSEEHRYPSCRSAPTQQAEIPLPVSPCQGSMKTGGVLAIVPARGGSKGLSRKNLRLLGGHPLTGWAVQAGVQAAAVERTICTTDDPEIAAVAKAYGAEVPFLRPPELAQDTTLDLPVFIHTLDWLADRENWQPEFVIHLRPTSPFRGRDYVDHAVRLLRGDPQCTSFRCPAGRDAVQDVASEQGRETGALYASTTRHSWQSGTVQFTSPGAAGRVLA